MIRPAAVTDAPALAALHVGGWLAAYRGIMPDELLDGLDVEARRAAWHDRLADGATALVAVDGDVPVGFVSYGPTRDADRLGCGEVYALYVDPGHWRHGVGRALLAAAVDTLRPQPAVLWVLTDNARARRFYEAQGWTCDGTEKASPWGPSEVRYEAPSA